MNRPAATFDAMIRTLLCAFIIPFATSLIHAQDTAYVAPPEKKKEPFPWKERLYYGGGIGLNFGTVTAIQLDPIVGVHLDAKHKFSIGFGPSYRYLKVNLPGGISTSAYGYRIFTRYRVIEQAFIHVELYQLNIDPRYYGFSPNTNLLPSRIWVPHLLVGGGYREPIGGNSSLYIQILWEVLQDPNSVYRGLGPIISAGVGIGF